MATRRSWIAQFLIGLVLLAALLPPQLAGAAPLVGASAAPAQLAGCSGVWVLLATVQPDSGQNVTGWPCYRASPSNADSYYITFPPSEPIPFNQVYEFSASPSDSIGFYAISNVVEVWGATLAPAATATATATATLGATTTPSNTYGSGCVNPYTGSGGSGDFAGKTWILGSRSHQSWNLVYDRSLPGPIVPFGIPEGVTKIAVQVDNYSGESYSSYIKSYTSMAGGSLLSSDRLFFHYYGSTAGTDPYYQVGFVGATLYLSFWQFFDAPPISQADICIWYGYSTAPTATPTTTPIQAPIGTHTPITTPTPLPLPLGCYRVELIDDKSEKVTLLGGSYSIRAQRFTIDSMTSLPYTINSGSPNRILFEAGQRTRTIALTLIATSSIFFDARNVQDEFIVDICPATTLATPTRTATATATALAIGTPTATATATASPTPTATLNPNWTPSPTAIGTPIAATTPIGVCVAALPTSSTGAGQLPNLALSLPTLAPLPTVITSTITISAGLVLSNTAQLIGAFSAPVATLTAWCSSTFGADGWSSGRAAAEPMAGQIMGALGWLAFFGMVGPLAWLLPPIVISLLVRVAKAVFSIVKYIKQIIPFAG